MRAHFILYVADQERSTAFYSRALGSRPSLDVPGMTEFTLSGEAVLGLMPVAGASRLLGESVEVPRDATRQTRAEIYLIVDDAAAFHRNSLEAGAAEVSPLTDRDWGYRVAYSLDPDGHVVAFAEEM